MFSAGNPNVGYHSVSVRAVLASIPSFPAVRRASLRQDLSCKSTFCQSIMIPISIYLCVIITMTDHACQTVNEDIFIWTPA